MVRRALRSRSLRKIKRVAPSGKNVVHFERRRPEKAKCAACKSELSGVPRLRQAKLSKLSGSKHKPSRMFGGKLCPSCAREEIKKRFL